MNTIIFIMCVSMSLFLMKKTIHSAMIGWLGFCMRGMAFGKESFVALIWLGVQVGLLYTAINHIPFSIVWN